MSQTTARIEEILYEGLLEIRDPQERSGFLDQTCRGNPELRSRLEKLVSLHGVAETFFGIVPQIGSPDFETRGELAKVTEGEFDDGLGTRIGRYRLIERLGEGGCGAVYLADQLEPVKRRVALKIIRVGFNTEHVIRHFESERQSLALMDHPNIARVLDAGTTDSGRPFFVMQLVDGCRITEFCDQKHLDLTERLKLFMLVCRAIQHAHQKGIIHCDIKPSNVMVTLSDGVAVPKVIDFGIARATEIDPLLPSAQSNTKLIGTPSYMSPEQVNGDGAGVDTRSDIYSLGALLYEVLTGNPPRDLEGFNKAETIEIRGVLLNEPIIKPSERLQSLPVAELAEIAEARGCEASRLARMLYGDLDAIVMKAMETERKLRYGTASELAADIFHFLNQEPVSARAEAGRGYRLGKLIKRNKRIFAAGTLVVFTLAAGFGTSTSLFFKEAHARQEQERLRGVAETARATEAKLREKAEAGEIVSHAAVLLNRGEIQQAYELLAQVKMENVPASLESANSFRQIAEWLLREGRWQDAANCFGAVAQAISRVDKSNSDSISLHFVAAAAALADADDEKHYNELRQMAAARFYNTTDPTISDEVVKTCLIKPAEPALLAELTPLIRSMESHIPWDRKDEPINLMEAWQMLSLTLVAYRKADFQMAESWARRCIRHPNVIQSRTAAVQAVLAMTLHHEGRPDEAKVELEQARSAVDGYFKEPFQINTAWTEQGYWFDWLIARLLFREAEGVMKN